MILQKHRLVTDGSYACGEHSITFRDVESLCCIPETKVMLRVNYTQFFKKLIRIKKTVKQSA